MTREEAALVRLRLMAQRAFGAMVENRRGGGKEAQKDLDAIDWAIATIQSKIARPQPDPDTGLMNCDYCNGGDEQKPLFHENNYEPHTRMQSYIEISESSYGKKPLICVDLWDGANACADFEINFCPMCGRKLEVEG